MAAVLFTLPLIGAVTVGDALAVLGTIASFLLRPHPATPTFKAMSSAWGQTWPHVYNKGRVAGKVIQASDVSKHSSKKNKKVPKYSQTFAVGFCEGPMQILRIWADQQVIYDARPIVTPTFWTADTQYAAGDIIYPFSIPPTVQFVATTDGQSGATEPTWNTAINAATRDNEVVWNTQKIPKARKLGQSYNYTMRIYLGDETQVQDSALEELVGAGNQSAYRGLCYAVLENFDLSKYGNRIPNLEAEVAPLAVPIAFGFDSDTSRGHVYNGFNDLYADPDQQYAYAWYHYVANDAFTGNVAVAKISITSPVVITYGEQFDENDDGAGFFAQTAPWGSWEGTDLWWSGFSGVHDAMIGVDKTTLNRTHTWTAVNMEPNGIVTPPQFNRDGSIGGGVFYTGNNSTGTQWLFLMNMADGTDSKVDLATIGGPVNRAAGTFWIPTFDDSGHVWFYDDHGKFYRFTITPGSPPTASAGTSFTGRTNDGAYFGPLDFNPDTGIMTAWSQKASGGDAWAVSIDTVTNIVGSVVSVDSGASGAWGGSADMIGWNNKRYVALYSVGYYDRLTQTTHNSTFLDLYGQSFFDTPGGGSMSEQSSVISADASDIVTAQRYSTFTPPLNTFWFFPLHAGGLTLAEINADIADRIGLSGKYDFSGLSSVVPTGITLEDRMSARQFVEQIMPAYFFDLTDIGSQIVGTLRSDASLLITIPEDDLAASESPETVIDRLAIERNDDLEIPRDLSVNYKDYLHDYQSGSTPSARLPITQHSSGRNTIMVPCVMTPSDAANVAERMLYLAWTERDTFKLTVPLEYFVITPADVIDVVRNSQISRIRVTKVTLSPGHIIEIEGCSEDFGTYALSAPADFSDQNTGTFVPGTLVPIVTPALNILDTASMRFDDLQNPGVYVGGCASVPGGGWDNEAVQESQDDSTWTTMVTLTVESVMGTCSTTLPNCVHYCLWDRVNTLRVSLLSGQLGSASEADLVANFTNLMWISNGELIQFATATLVSGDGNEGTPYVYDLTNLLRGRFGTESFTGTHSAGEQFCMPDPSAMLTADYSPSELDATRYWRGMNDAEDTPTTDEQTLVMTTRRLMPYAPYYIKGARDGSNNLTITGLRRMRWRGTPLWKPPETDSPITIEVDIYNGVSVVRTITSTASGGGSVVTDASTFSVYYSAADQTTDFGSAQASVVVKVYQLNAVRGRGYPGAATV